ncbi:MAG: hypothetical protein AB1646_02560 [Thermodesulfobacteriota bacterium]
MDLNTTEGLGMPKTGTGNGTSAGLGVDGLTGGPVSESVFSGAFTISVHPDTRVDRIRQSYFLLKQFSPRELKILMGLKRNTSPKAWTLREDLLILTLSLSNREIAEALQERNKEAVKKRLQLLRSKGLGKRVIEPPPASPAPEANTPEASAPEEDTPQESLPPTVEPSEQKP